MARRPNYDYEKRRKEMERKAKKEAKREDLLRRRREGNAGDDADGQADGADAPEAGNGEAALADDSAERG